MKKIIFSLLALSLIFGSISGQSKIEKENEPLKSSVIFSNPLEYDFTYIFELYPDFSTIDKNKDLKLWITVPREWDSQKNVHSVSVEPEPDSKYIDQEYGNDIIYWDFGPYSEDTLYRIEVQFRVEAFEIHTSIEPSKIKMYDITSKEYELYTKSGKTIDITPKVKEFAKEAIIDEVNPYLQAKRIFEFVKNKVHYKLTWEIVERGRGITTLLNYPLVDKNTGEEYYEGYCTHMSALFIAMCRSVGIPARSVFGFIGPIIVKKEKELKQPAFEFEKEISSKGFSGAQHHGVMGPHMWAEFYLQDIGWIPADPNAGLFGELYGMKVIMGKGRDIYLGPEAPRSHHNGYGSQFVLLYEGRVDYPLYGVWNIAKIRTAKVKILHHSDK